MIRPPRPPAELGRAEFTMMLAMVMALQALGIDTMLPALGEMAVDLGASDPNHRQLIVGSYLIGMGAGSLVFGFLADRFGRRRVLLAGIATYCCFDFLCMVIDSFPMMIAFRFANGMVASAGAVIANAVVRDKYEGDAMASMVSMIAVVFMVVPVLAPTIGQAILLFAGWRSIFGLMFAMGIIMFCWVYLRLAETMHPDHRQDLDLGRVGRNFRTILTNRDAVGYVFGATLVFGGLYGYLNSSEQLVAHHFGLGEKFAYVFGGMALCMAASNFVNARIVEKFGARRVSHSALLLFVVMAGLQWLAAHYAPDNFWLFAPLMAVNLSLIGFLGANFSSIALQPFRHFAGSASSLQNAMRVGGGAILGALVGSAYDGTAQPVGMSMFLFSLLGLLLVLFSEKGKLFRRRKETVTQVAGPIGPK
ncbi:multidrug effflux MFS transporter [Croceicoccus mobilis]|uniref:Bcr/CflA family efflux transporter n=1 Tax=Croceicoccus mobilis TaxID=1703339 RepID=A0A916Z397_9SPHN|nr:multidrug effflux MFS transporter [Croceicoccus mobilis]GGD73672.1 Bcr/CflA family drug resistance efflux transporter [Croceicoccus mobilis]